MSNLNQLSTIVITEINSKDDVVLFATELIAEGVNFQPDEDFRNFINLKTGEETYTAKQAAVRNKLMDCSFEVCDQLGIDVYDLTMEVFLIETGLSDMIPLPSADPES